MLDRSCPPSARPLNKRFLRIKSTCLDLMPIGLQAADSDYDLCVVIPDGSMRPQCDQRIRRALFPVQTTPLDVIRLPGQRIPGPSEKRLTGKADCTGGSSVIRPGQTDRLKTPQSVQERYRIARHIAVLQCAYFYVRKEVNALVHMGFCGGYGAGSDFLLDRMERSWSSFPSFSI